MARRVFIGNNGGGFLFRASTPGVDAVTGPPESLTAYETMVPCVPKASGTVFVPPASSLDETVSVPIPAIFSYPPFLLIKSTDGILPGSYTIGGWFVAGTSPRLELFNRAPGGRTIKWWAFAEF